MCVHVVREEKSADAVSCNSEDIATQPDLQYPAWWLTCTVD